MSLTRRQLLKRTGLAGLALALGRLIVTPELEVPTPGPEADRFEPKWANVKPNWIDPEHLGLVTASSSDEGGMLWITLDGEQHYLKCYDIDWQGG